MGDGMDDCVWFAIERLCAVTLQPTEEFGVAKRAIFDDLGVTRKKLSSWKRGQQSNVRDDATRLVKDADEILSLGNIDRGLASDRRVDLGQKRGRNLHDVNASLKNSGCKARQVSDDTASGGYDDATAINSRAQERA